MPCPEPVELIVLAVKAMNVRCRRLPEREIVVLRPADGTEEIAEGEILKVLPAKEWRYKGTPYLSGRVIDSFIDVSILTPVPLKLFLQTAWDPYDDFAGLWGVDADGRMPAGLPEWVLAVLKASRRLVYQTEQIIPGAGPDGLTDPMDAAVECAHNGDLDTAFGILQKCLESDLRCLDAYAHLGKYHFGNARLEWRVRRARKCYQAGVQVGEQALPPGFDGLLPWRWIDNRPFLRALHGLGLCQWRLGEFREARETFRRIFLFDPLDALGVRYLLPEVEEGRDYLSYVEKERQDLH